MSPENSEVSLRRPLKILHVLGSLNRGGIESWLCRAIPCISQERYQCDFCTYRFSRGAYATDLEGHGCKFHSIPLGTNPLALIRFAKRFRQLLREGRYDAVHCHGLLLIGFILFLARMESTPVRIAHGHSTDRKTGPAASAANRLGLALNRILTRLFSTHGVACSAEAGVALFGRCWRGNAKYKLIHCGIDLTSFRIDCGSDSIRSSLGIPPGAMVIGHVGSFSVAKNHRFLTEVAAQTFRQSERTVLLLVGDGILRPSIEETCRALGITERVIFVGLSSCVPELMRCAMDVFVMPSLHEGLPLVLLEAQAAGLPCLVSDVVSREAMVSDGTIEFLPLSSGASTWADATLSLLNKTARPTDLAARMADTDYNVVVSARHIEELYDSAEDASHEIQSRLNPTTRRRTRRDKMNRGHQRP